MLWVGCPKVTKVTQIGSNETLRDRFIDGTKIKRLNEYIWIYCKHFHYHDSYLCVQIYLEMNYNRVANQGFLRTMDFQDFVTTPKTLSQLLRLQSKPNKKESDLTIASLLASRLHKSLLVSQFALSINLLRYVCTWP